MTTKGVEERLTFIEATLPHLATKADLAGLRAELITEIKSLETRLILRLGGLMIVGFSAVVAVLRLWQ